VQAPVSLADKIRDRCARRFGLTEDYLAANWVLPGGLMIRGFRERDLNYEDRIEHDDIVRCLPKRELAKSNLDPAEFFMVETGAVRVNGGWVHVDCANELDSAQMDIIENAACAGDGCIWDVTRRGEDFASSGGDLDPNGLRAIMAAYRRCRAR